MLPRFRGRHSDANAGAAFAEPIWSVACKVPRWCSKWAEGYVAGNIAAPLMIVLTSDRCHVLHDRDLRTSAYRGSVCGGPLAGSAGRKITKKSRLVYSN
jgi:hypothetical protein